VIVPDRKPNSTDQLYGREYREGHRISTARVDSIVEQLGVFRLGAHGHRRYGLRIPVEKFDLFLAA
jgi:hypothetical protein